MNASLFKFIPGMFCLLAFLLLTAPSESHAAIQSDNPVTHGKTWTQLTTVEKTQVVCILLSLPVFFVAEVWFIVAGFQASIGWGLFMLFIGGLRSVGAALAMIGWMLRWIWLTHEHQPLQTPALILGVFVVFAGSGAFIFIVRHWQHARNPLRVMALGIILILAAVALEFAK